MPDTIRATVAVKDVRDDLRALGEGIDKPITDTMGRHAGRIADLARMFLHHGAPTWPTSRAAGDFPGGVRAYYDAKVTQTSATIGSIHPGAPVWEWGGTIDPGAGGGVHRTGAELRANARARAHIAQAGGRQGFTIPRDQPVNRAADADLPAFERDLQGAVDRLIAEHGF